MARELEDLPVSDGMFLRDAVGGQIKDVDDDSREVIAVFPHDTVDTFNTTFDRNAFKESFDKRLPLMCWQHDLRDPIGRAIRAQALPDRNEIVGKFSDFDAVPNAKRAYSQISDGTITDFSFGFRQPKYEPHRQYKGVRNIRSAVMMEFSPVSVGSIPGAVATGLREEDLRMEHSASEIAALVQAGVLDPEEGKRMLAQLDGYRDYVTIKSPETAELEELRELARAWKKGEKPPWLKSDKGDDDDADDKKRADDAAARVVELEAELASRSDSAPYVLPAVINAETILQACPEPLQRALIDQNAVLAVGPEGTEFFREDESDVDEESAGMIAGAIAAAHASAQDWIKDTERAALPDEVQQALLLVDAASTSTKALLDVLGVDNTRDGDSPYSQPANPAGSENMGPTAVKCLTCNGKGVDEDGKACPVCHGSGVEAVTRGEGTAIINPDGSVRCPSCLGLGKRANGEECRTCGGKGNLPGNEGHSGSPNVRSDGLDVRFVSEAARSEMAKKGVAMDNGDFPIPDKGHLQSALGHFSGYTGDKTEAKAHIEKRAKALGVELSEGDFSTRAVFEGDGDEADKPGADSGDQQHDNESQRKKKQAMAKLNKHAIPKVGKSEPTGGHPDLDTETVDHMPVPVNHTATP